jgi:hypothetical protein
MGKRCISQLWKYFLQLQALPLVMIYDIVLNKHSGNQQLQDNKYIYKKCKAEEGTTSSLLALLIIDHVKLVIVYCFYLLFICFFLLGL